MAGAYLLRAIAESGVLPPRAVFTLGTLYAVAWLLWAARAPVERRLATTLYSLTSVLILSPLLWEATLRFHMITTWEASTILVAFTLIGLAVSWRRDLLVVATISTLAGLGTAGALLIATHDALPFTFVFLAIAAAVEACACLNHWLGERWLAAAAANLSVLLATWLVTNPNGLPEVYAPISPRALFAAQMALLAIYLSSVMVRTLLRGLAFTTFETGQCALAFVIGLGGAMRLSAGGAHITPAIGGFALVCGAACYAISFIVLERHGSHGRNFYTYSTFGILLVLVGCRMLLSDGAAGNRVVSAGRSVYRRGRALGKTDAGNPRRHLPGAGARALGRLATSPRGFCWEPNLWLDSAHAALWIGVAVAGASYLLAVRFAPSIGDGWNFRAFRLALAAVLVWEVLGLSAGGLTGIYHGLFGIAAGDPYCATIRTGAVTGAALLLAFAGSRAQLQPPCSTGLSPHAPGRLSPGRRGYAPGPEGCSISFAAALWRRAHGDTPSPPRPNKLLIPPSEAGYRSGALDEILAADKKRRWRDLQHASYRLAVWSCFRSTSSSSEAVSPEGDFAVRVGFPAAP